LRQKKRALREVESKDNQYQRLLEMMQQLGQTKQNKQILDAYKAGANAFKATLQRQGISPEQVDETMDSISDAMATAEEIQDAITAGAPQIDSDELSKDLEAELDAILADDTKADVSTLPEVPKEQLEAEEAETIATRLKRLREAA
uniref:Snf7 family protein n=1 Tax=Gongylonema pulchrum TaxID=637853 RepID=A0A183ESB3_9BILA